MNNQVLPWSKPPSYSEHPYALDCGPLVEGFQDRLRTVRIITSQKMKRHIIT